MQQQNKKIKIILKKIRWRWIKFWGRRYWVIKDEEVIQEILFYKHRIYIIEDIYSKDEVIKV